MDHRRSAALYAASVPHNNIKELYNLRQTSVIFSDKFMLCSTSVARWTVVLLRLWASSSLAQVPVPRSAYAPEVTAALARGANSPPPNPEQAGALEAARAETEVARAAEATARTALAEVGVREASERKAYVSPARPVSASSTANIAGACSCLPGRSKQTFCDRRAAKACRHDVYLN